MVSLYHLRHTTVYELRYGRALHLLHLYTFRSFNHGSQKYGIYPRESFNLDAELEITTADTAAAVTLKLAKTIRVILIGATIAGDGDVTVNIGGKDVVFLAGDLDGNGVGIAHIRGALLDGDNNVVYAANANTGSASVAGGVYYELLDSARR